MTHQTREIKMFSKWLNKYTKCTTIRSTKSLVKTEMKIMMGLPKENKNLICIVIQLVVKEPAHSGSARCSASVVAGNQTNVSKMRNLFQKRHKNGKKAFWYANRSKKQSEGKQLVVPNLDSRKIHVLLLHQEWKKNEN